MVRVNETLLEPPPNGRGLYNYLWENVKFNFLFYLLYYKSQSLSETKLQIFSAFKSTLIFTIVILKLSQRCDLLVHDAKPTFKRIQMADHTLPWAYEQFAFLIPVPEETANLNAIIKPFQWPVGTFVEII